MSPVAPPGPSTPLSDLFVFDSRVVVVTGGGAGIGEAICRRLAGAGASVVVVDIDAAGAQRVASSLPRARAVAGDVRVPATAHEAVDVATRELGGLHVLVNCAGLYPSVPMLDLAEQQWDEIVDVNLKGAFLFSQAAAAAMARGGGGVIVNIASRAGLRARPGVVAYSAAKAGVIALTQGLAMELADQGIRVNAVAPGPVATAQAQVAAQAKAAGTSQHAESLQDEYRARIPLHRFADPDEIAIAVAFLASPASSFITGAVLPVDGGALLP